MLPVYLPLMIYQLSILGRVNFISFSWKMLSVPQLQCTTCLHVFPDITLQDEYQDKENCTWITLINRYQYVKAYKDGRHFRVPGVNDCRALCMAIPTCWSIDFRMSVRYCQLHKGNTTIVKADYNSNWDLHVITCGPGELFYDIYMDSLDPNCNMMTIHSS